MDSNTSDQLRREHLIDPAELDAVLADPSQAERLRIVDMRGAVKTQTDETGYQTAQYLGRRSDYEAGHLPGAIYLDWTSDLIDENDPVPAQAAPPEKLARVLGEAGIGDEHLVVASDDHPSSQFATRLWWLLRYYGHGDCRVLDGGLPRWLREGRPITTEVVRYPQARFTPRPRPEWRKTAEDVLALLGAESVSLVDARDEGQYTGRIRRGLRGGHIPGALSFPREALMTEDGTFRPDDELRAAIGPLGLQPDREVVAYCNGGVAATSVLFALSMLGFRNLSNYDGSWNEWNQRLDLPVESS